MLDVGISLWMRKHDAEPPELEVEDEVGELQWPAEVRELEQQERGVAAEPEPAEIGVVEPRRVLEVELSSRQHLDWDRGLTSSTTHLGDTELHLPRRGRIVLPHVRSGCDLPDAVVVRRAEQVEALGNRLHAVVDPRKHVRMQVDHDSPS